MELQRIQTEYRDLSVFSPNAGKCGKMWTRITPNTDTFYAVLGSVIKKVKSTDNLVITGNFNVKTGTAALESNIYKKQTGIYGKGKANSNGYILLKPAKSQSLKITNTFFKHKNRHRSTWKSPIKISQT